MPITLPTTGNPYQAKDQRKADHATQLIAVGAPGSSTDQYARGVEANRVNTGQYTEHDVVFISINGQRHNRIPVFHPRLQPLIDAVIDAKAAIITDNPADRARAFNIGERELAHYLRARGYVENGNGVWAVE